MSDNLIFEGNTIYEIDPDCMNAKRFLAPNRQQEACVGCGTHRPEAESTGFRFCGETAAGRGCRFCGKEAASGESGFRGKTAASVSNPSHRNNQICPLLGAVILSACCRKTGCANR